jgi:hypothetical protein
MIVEDQVAISEFSEVCILLFDPCGWIKSVWNGVFRWGRVVVESAFIQSYSNILWLWLCCVCVFVFVFVLFCKCVNFCCCCCYCYCCRYCCWCRNIFNLLLDVSLCVLFTILLIDNGLLIYGVIRWTAPPCGFFDEHFRVAN